MRVASGWGYDHGVGHAWARKVLPESLLCCVVLDEGHLCRIVREVHSESLSD